MNVKYWTKAGKIKADRIETKSIKIGREQIEGMEAAWFTMGFGEPITINYKDHSGINKTISFNANYQAQYLKVLAEPGEEENEE